MQQFKPEAPFRFEALNAPPMWLQVKTDVAARIAKGEWPPGTRMPNEADLARKYGVAAGTMRKALDALEAERALVRRQGHGTFINDMNAVNRERMAGCAATAQAIIDAAMDEANTRPGQVLIDELRKGIANALFEAGADYPT